jgi:hypothetical protein
MEDEADGCSFPRRRLHLGGTSEQEGGRFEDDRTGGRRSDRFWESFGFQRTLDFWKPVMTTEETIQHTFAKIVNRDHIALAIRSSAFIGTAPTTPD